MIDEMKGEVWYPGTFSDTFTTLSTDLQNRNLNIHDSNICLCHSHKLSGNNADLGGSKEFSLM